MHDRKIERPFMLSDTLSEGLEAYRIGEKVRSLRIAKGLGLAQLGEHTGLSAGMLSKVERGQVFPTLPTLLRIALVFGVSLEHFFAGGEQRPVLEIVRASDRLRLPNPPGAAPAFHFESLDFPVQGRKTEAYLADFAAGAPASPPHEHQGVELVYVIEGAFALNIHGKRHELGCGDSIYFDSGFEHSYCASPSSDCRIIVAVHAQGDAETD